MEDVDVIEGFLCSKWIPLLDLPYLLSNLPAAFSLSAGLNETKNLGLAGQLLRSL